MNKQDQALNLKNDHVWIWKEELPLKEKNKASKQSEKRFSLFSRYVVSDSCDPMDCSLPGSSVHGILRAITLEWVAISVSSGSSPPRNRTRVSCFAGRFFTDWAMRKALDKRLNRLILFIQVLGEVGQLSTQDAQVPNARYSGRRLSQQREKRESTIRNVKSSDPLVFLSFPPCLSASMDPLTISLASQHRLSPALPLTLFSLAAFGPTQPPWQCLCACAGWNGKKVKMAAARAGVLGVRWLQKAARNMVPMGARTGPLERARPQCGWVGGAWGLLCRAQSGFGGVPRPPSSGKGGGGVGMATETEGRSAGRSKPRALTLKPEAFRVAGKMGRLLTCTRLPSSLPHYQGHAPGTLSQDPRRTGCRRQEV